jgi:hypothetical protein
MTHTAEDFLGGEVVQSANLILLAPLAPVLRGTPESFIHGRDFSHPDCGAETLAFRPGRTRRVTSPEMSVQYGMFETSARARRAHALPSTRPRQGMPWLRGEATGLPGLRTAN